MSSAESITPRVQQMAGKKQLMFSSDRTPVAEGPGQVSRRATLSLEPAVPAQPRQSHAGAALAHLCSCWPPCRRSRAPAQSCARSGRAGWAQSCACRPSPQYGTAHISARRSSCLSPRPPCSMLQDSGGAKVILSLPAGGCSTLRGPARPPRLRAKGAASRCSGPAGWVKASTPLPHSHPAAHPPAPGKTHVQPTASLSVPTPDPKDTPYSSLCKPVPLQPNCAGTCPAHPGTLANRVLVWAR